MTPRVSVCIPTYNPSPVHLTEALRSLLAQTVTDWEAIVHDDASPNANTQSIVEPFLLDQRIRLVLSSTRLGIGGNWNACERLTKAPIIAYLFQDDIWEPGYLERALAILEREPSVGFVSLGHTYKIEGSVSSAPMYEGLNRFKSEHVASGIHPGREFLKWWTQRGLHPNVIGEPSFVVIRRSALTAAGPFCQDMPQQLDTEAWTRLLAVSDWYNEPAMLGSFRVHGSATSAFNQETGQGLYDRLRCLEGVLKLLKGEDRTVAVRACATALEGMVEKFFNRATVGKKISGQGSGAVKSFVLKHPVMTIRALLIVFARKIKQWLRGGQR